MLYVHTKTGTEYRVIAHSLECTNARYEAPTVVYIRAGETFWERLSDRLVVWLLRRCTVYTRDDAEFAEKFVRKPLA